MSYVPIQGIALPFPFPIEKTKELAFEQSAVQVVALGILVANPLIFAKWKLTKQTPSQFSSAVGASVMAAMRITAGAGSVGFAWLESPDDSTWGTITNQAFSGDAGFTPKINTIRDANLADDTEFIALAAFNSNGTVIGELKNFIGTLLLTLPEGTIIERIV